MSIEKCKNYKKIFNVEESSEIDRKIAVDFLSNC